jgi:hypothetical protein
VLWKGKVNVIDLRIMTYEDKQALWVAFWIFVLWLLRKQKPFDTIWNIFKLFIIITLIIVTAGMAAKWVKSWFN